MLTVTVVFHVGVIKQSDDDVITSSPSGELMIAELQLQSNHSVDSLAAVKSPCRTY